MFCRLVYDLLASGEWWDTIPADSDRWGARKFTIGPNGSRKRLEYLSIYLYLSIFDLVERPKHGNVIKSGIVCS